MNRWLPTSDPTPEEIFGTPEELVEDATWAPRFMNVSPLKQLWATCLHNWHDLPVGETFRWSDEQIRLTSDMVTTAEAWQKKTDVNRFGQGFKGTVRLYCEQCERLTDHAARGWRWATS